MLEVVMLLVAIASATWMSLPARPETVKRRKECQAPVSGLWYAKCWRM